MITIRTSTPDEIPLQKDLWKKCFGDTDAYIDVFYEKFCTADKVLIVDDDGELNSMCAVLSTTLHFPDGTSIPTGYIYALATNPYFQGKGYARQLLKFADDFLQKQGMKCLTLVPSNAGLHRFFDNIGLSECFATRKVEIPDSGLNGPDPSWKISPIEPHEYNIIRERYLQDTFHISYGDQLIHFQQIGSRMALGDLYRLEIDGEVGVAAIEFVQKRRLLFKELLIPQNQMMKAVELVASILPATRYHVRTPAFWEGIPGSYIQSFGMIKWYDLELRQKWFQHQDAYMGLGFD